MSLPSSTAELERLVFDAAWQRIVDMGPPDDERLSAHLSAVQALADAMTGRLARAEQRAHEAIARATDRWPGIEGRARAARVEVAIRRDDLGATDEEARVAYELLEPAAADWRSLLEVRMGQVAAMHGQDEGLEQAAHGAEALERAGHGLASHSLLVLADLHAPEHPDQAMALRERAAAVGPPDDRCAAHLSLAAAHRRAERLSLASHHVAEARDALPAAIEPRTEALLLEAEALHRHQAGDLPAALVLSERALDAATLAGEPTRALRLRARLLGLGARPREGLELASRLPPGAAHEALQLGLMALAHPDIADQALWRAQRLTRSRPLHDEPIAELYEAVGAKLAASGQPRRLVEAARHLARQVAPHAVLESLPEALGDGELTVVGDWAISGEVATHLAFGTRGAWLRRSDGHPDSLESHAEAARLDALQQVAHPSLAALLDHGRLEPREARAITGRPRQLWAVTEPLPGLRLDAVAGRVVWAEVASLLQQILGAVAHLHAHGHLHLRLSAEHVGIAGEGHRHHVLVGGLAAPPHPVPLTPEQHADGEVGTATDLFAVGLLAWQLVTGRPPWPLDDAATLPDSWRRGPPPLVPSSPVPAGFEAWLRRLLSPDVEHRFPLAAEAAQALERLGDPDAGATPVPVGRRTHGPRRSAEPAPTLPARWPADPPAPSFQPGRRRLALPPLVGHETAREVLWQALADALATQRPHLVIVEGPSGAGRSAVIRWLLRAAARTGAARTLTIDEGPGHSLRDRLTDLLAARRVRDDDLDLHLAERLPQLDADQRHALRALVKAGHHPAQPLAVATVLRSQAPARPLVVGLARDPAHEPLTVPLTQELLRREAPVLVLLELDEDLDPSLAAAVTELRGHAGAREVSLRHPASPTDTIHTWAPLEADTTVALASGAHLGLARGRLEHQLAAGGLTWRDGQLALAAPSGPRHDSIAALWAKRLRDATATLPRLALDGVAAAFLPEGSCDLARWEAVRRQLGLEVDPMPALWRSGLVVPRSAGWHLAHPALTPAIAGWLARSPLRGAVAQAARSLARGRPPEQLAQLALLTGRPDAALAPLYQAALAATRLGDAARAERLVAQYDEALSAVGATTGDRRWIASHLLRSQGLLDQGRSREARELAEQALSLVPTASEERARALDALAEASDRCGDLPTARRAWGDATKQWARFQQHDRSRASALAEVHALRRRGRVAEALRSIDRMPSHPLVSLARGIVLAVRGDDDEADQVLGALVRDVAGEDAARLHLWRARMSCRAERPDEARSHIAKARRTVESRPGLFRTQLALAEAYVAAREGQLAAASRLAEAALAQRREPEVRAWGLALRLSYGPKQATDAVSELEMELARGGRCDPDLAWAIDRATEEATDALTVARLARRGAAMWRSLWQNARG